MRDYERRLQELRERLDAEAAHLRQDLEKRLGLLDKGLDEHGEKIAMQLRREAADRTTGFDDLESRTLQAQRTLRSELQGAIQVLEAELERSEPPLWPLIEFGQSAVSA